MHFTYTSTISISSTHTSKHILVLSKCYLSMCSMVLQYLCMCNSVLGIYGCTLSLFNFSLKQTLKKIFQVGWLREADQTILSMHTKTVTQNARVTISYEAGSKVNNAANTGNYEVTGTILNTLDVTNGTWNLHIRNLKESDRGCYMCQINTSPMVSKIGCLDILGNS